MRSAQDCAMELHRTVYVTQRAPVHQDVARAACPEQLDLVMLVSPSTSEIVDAVADAEFLVSERSRVIVLLLPHSAETAGIADDRFLSRLRPGSLLVNAGASTLLNEEAVARAYRTGHLGGVATDGFTWEPVRPDNPLVALAADRGANVILTPHSALAGLVLDTAARRAEYTNLLAVIEGRPLLHQIA